MSHHSIILEHVHEVRSLLALIVGEPARSLRGIPSVQQENVLMPVAYLLDGRLTPCHAAVTLALPGSVDRALTAVRGRLLDPGMDVIGVEQDEVQSGDGVWLRTAESVATG